MYRLLFYRVMLFYSMFWWKLWKWIGRISGVCEDFRWPRIFIYNPDTCPWTHQGDKVQRAIHDHRCHWRFVRTFVSGGDWFCEYALGTLEYIGSTMSVSYLSIYINLVYQLSSILNQFIMHKSVNNSIH